MIDVITSLDIKNTKNTYVLRNKDCTEIEIFYPVIKPQPEVVLYNNKCYLHRTGKLYIETLGVNVIDRIQE